MIDPSQVMKGVIARRLVAWKDMGVWDYIAVHILLFTSKMTARAVRPLEI
jgi:hypothetical protein